MSLGLLPWERWLPPYIFGPSMFLGSMYFLFAADLATWQYVLFILTAICGAVGSWMWFAYRKNIFDPSLGSDKTVAEKMASQSAKSPDSKKENEDA